MTRRATEARPSPWLIAIAVAVAVVFAGPFAYLVVRNGQLGADVLDTLTRGTTLVPLARTLVLATSVAATAAVLGTGVAWLVTRTDLPGRRWLAAVAPLPLVLPSFVGAAAVVAAVALLGELDVIRPRQVRGFWPSWAVLSLLTYPFVTLPVAARLRRLSPAPEESARLLGRSPWATFASVVLPQVRGAIEAGALLVFLYTLSDFGVVATFQYGTLTRVLFAVRVDAATALPLSLVLGAVAVAVAGADRVRAGRRPATDSSGSGRRPLVIRLGRWRWPAAGSLVALLGVALAVPVAVFTWWAARGDAFGSVGELTGPAATTASLGALTAVAAVAVTLPVAVAASRVRSRWSAVPTTVMVAGFALPGLVTALALVFWVLQLPAGLGLYPPPLPILVLAYVIHFGAQALVAASVALGGVPRRVGDAARVLGARPARRFASVDLPLMLPGLLAGGGLVLLSTVKELPATLLLAPTGIDTLATRTWGSLEASLYGETGVAALALVAVSGVLTWLLVLRPARERA